MSTLNLDPLPGLASSRHRETVEEIVFGIGHCFVRFTGVPASWEADLPDRLAACRLACVGKRVHDVEVYLSSDPDLLPGSRAKDLNRATEYAFHEEYVEYTSHWVRARLDLRDGGTSRLVVHERCRNWFAGVLENFLRLRLAYELLGSDGLILHSAAIVGPQGAVVLFGHSGAGKSTASQFALDHGFSVVSDDLNILRKIDGQWMVMPTPFSGSLNHQSDITQAVPLAGLYQLNQASAEDMENCSRGEAVALLIGSSPFLNRDPYRQQALLAALSGLVQDQAVRKLYFRRAPEFLAHVMPGRRRNA